MRSLKGPDCQHCDTASKPEMIAFLVPQKGLRIEEIYLCACCAKETHVFVTDPDDHRLRDRRPGATTPSAGGTSGRVWHFSHSTKEYASIHDLALDGVTPAVLFSSP